MFIFHPSVGCLVVLRQLLQFHAPRSPWKQEVGARRRRWCWQGFVVSFLEWLSPLSMKATRYPAAFLLRHICQKRLGQEAPGKGGQTCTESAALHRTGFLSSRWQKAAKQVTCCLAHCPLALHLFSYSRKSVPLAPRGFERSRNLPKWWQAVPEDPGRILHKAVNTGKSYKQDTSF